MSGSNNGGNARLDRIEKLIEQTVRATKDAERANKEAHALHKQEMRQIREELRGWARNQRTRAQEIDGNITRLAAAQLVTEEKLQRFISSVGRGRNGH